MRRLKFIRAAQVAGFTLEQIAKLLELDASEDRVRARALAEERIAVLDAKIADLVAARASLTRLVHDCGSGGAGPCPIIMTFEENSRRRG